MENGNSGIKAGVGSTIATCTSGQNQIGIEGAHAGTVIDCTTNNNTLHGISVGSGNRVVGNRGS